MMMTMMMMIFFNLRGVRFTVIRENYGGHFLPISGMTADKHIIVVENYCHKNMLMSLGEIYYMLLFIIVRKHGYWQLSNPFLRLLVQFLQISHKRG